MRTLLEVYAAEKSVTNLTTDSRERLAVAHIRLTEVYSDPQSSRRERETVHREFHTAVVSDCGSPRLLRIVSELLDLAARYRVVATEIRGGRAHVLQEHSAIAMAALEGNGDQTRLLVGNHLRTTFELSLIHISEPTRPY